MKKILCCLMLLAQGMAWAQDSALLNLGRVQMNKEFTQHVVIKGEDLRKMHFTSLSEAINERLYGLYTHSGTVTYVVDGVAMASPDLYNIYDIDEIILVQNAAGTIAGATMQQHLVLIRTVKSRLNQAFQINAYGMSHLVNRKSVGVQPKYEMESENNFVHQYGVNGSVHQNRFSAWFGLDVTRDVQPSFIDSTYLSHTPDHFLRYRANGRFQYMLSSSHRLFASLHYLEQPGEYGYAIHYFTPGYVENYRQDRSHKIFLPQIGWEAGFGKGFTNRLTASYGYKREKEENELDVTPAVYHARGESREKIRSLLLMNQLQWKKQAGKLELMPSLNISYRASSHRYDLSSVSPGQVFTFHTEMDDDVFLITPSFSLLHANRFYFNGGMALDMSPDKTEDYYPFASAGVHLFKKVSGFFNALTIFGSVAASTNFRDQLAGPADFSGQFLHPGNAIPGTNPIPVAAPENEYTTYQAGANMIIAKNLVSLSYNYENREYTGLSVIPVFGGNYMDLLHDARAQSHRIQLSFQVLGGHGFTWNSSLVGASIKNSGAFSRSDKVTYAYNVGDFSDQERSWTGGFNNRIQINRVLIGVDLLYHFNRQLWVPSALFMPEMMNADIFSLKHAFISYQFHFLRNRQAEIFLSTRNGWQNDHYNSFVADPRRYYGAGIRVGQLVRQ